MFVVSEEPLGDHIKLYHKIKKTEMIIDAFKPEELEFLWNSTFGKILAIDKNPPFLGAFVQCIIGKLLKMNKKYEIWILFAGRPLWECQFGNLIYGFFRSLVFLWVNMLYDNLLFYMINNFCYMLHFFVSWHIFWYQRIHNCLIWCYKRLEMNWYMVYLADKWFVNLYIVRYLFY